MIRLTTRRIVPILSAFAIAGSAHAGSEPEPRIVLFGANWCAPCLAELRELPQIASAAAPDRVIIAWIDEGVRISDKAEKAGVMQVSAASARDLMARHGTGNAGLPLAVMLGSDGKRCAMVRRRLDSAGIASLRRECGTAR